MSKDQHTQPSTHYLLRAMGMINALGRDKQTIKARMLAGDHSGMQAQGEWVPEKDVVVGMVEGEMPLLPAPFARYDCRNSALLWLAYQQIAPNIEVALQEVGAARIGVVLGSSTTGIASAEEAVSYHQQTGDFPPGFHYRIQEIGTPSLCLAELIGAKGPVYTVSTACSSSARAFASARNLLAMGICDAVVVGGVDSLCKLTVRGFSSLGAVSESLCNPWSQHRKGINIGESATLFLMQKSESCDGIELLGVGESSDAHHISAPDPAGTGAQFAMADALRDAGLNAEDIAYINLHGTGTPLNDAMEGAAVSALFGQEVPCSSTKPLTGHTLGAAGATEVGLCWLLLDSYAKGEGELPLPPHVWDEQVDPSIPPVRLVRRGESLQPTQTPYVLSNSFAFGGNNCAVILGPAQMERSDSQMMK